MACRCTRIWWVRPVSSSTRRSDRSAQRFDQLKPGRGLARDVGVGRNPRRLSPIAANGRLDPARARRRAATHQRRVDAADLAPAQLRLQLSQGDLVPSDHQQPRGVAIEPVHDPRSILGAASDTSAEHLHQGWPGRSRRGVREHPRRLVHHHQPIILVHDGDIRQRPRRPARARRLGNPDQLPRREPVRLWPALPIHRDRARGHQALRRSAGTDFGLRRHEPIEPDTLMLAVTRWSVTRSRERREPHDPAARGRTRAAPRRSR